ncbi:MAG: hypothetical protein GTN73_05420 [Candidatus Aminicenantes bacterium]|nr:hypothetical protein [Candidatus Aminicenantes bacterium]
MHFSKGNIEEFDVIIVGASFAGLSVASGLKGNILLIDRCNIGDCQISACGAPVDVVKEIGCEDSVLQASNIFSFHVNKKKIDFCLERPYCTFDFRKFCQIFASKTNAIFTKANVARVEKYDKFIVHTKDRKFNSKILVDASGWEASAVNSLKTDYVHSDMLSFGIETEAPYMATAFHFFYEPDFLKDGISWIFPCGEFSRFGVASYTGRRKLKEKLDSFLERYNLRCGKIHGGSFCYSFKEPVVEDIFVVGCAQGQTLPLTGEGIRRSIFYGVRLSAIIQRILTNEISFEKGVSEYTRLALNCSREYNFLFKFQERFLKMSKNRLEILARILSNRLIFRILERKYRSI